jgi:acetolactate decarboxylase
MMKLSFRYLLLMIFAIAKITYGQVPVKYAGAQMKVRQGDLSPAVMLDTLPKQHLYAIGPEADLRSEIFVWDGRIFRAGVLKENGLPYVEKDVVGMQAVFLVWAQVPEWDTLVIYNAIPDMQTLETTIGKYAFEMGVDTSKPFPFLMFGKIKQGKGHIMDKDPAVNADSPNVAEVAKKYFPLENQKAQFIGFYSHHHQRIFTHHDSFVHLHYRLYSKHHAGHLDEVAFDPAEPVTILIPTRL